MKPELRRQLAQQSFEEKICKVGQLIELSRKVKTQPTAEESGDYTVSAIRNRRNGRRKKNGSRLLSCHASLP